MDRHKCKLCFRSFANGRALGGHMRSHMMNLPISKPEELASPRTIQLSFEAESASSSSSSENDDDDAKGLCYGLRENPKRSIRLVDPEFSFAAVAAARAADAGSVILHDRESESESSKNNPTRRRSKRPWNNNDDNYYNNNYSNDINNDVATIYNSARKKGLGFEHESTVMSSMKSKTESWMDHDPASSVSDATTEEDVAFCLMMLSRDKWKRKRDHQDQPQFVELEDQYEEEDDDEEEEDEDEDEAFEESEESQETMKLCSNKNRARGRYKCDTCNKVFRSYQALGGHRASHKKTKVNAMKFDGGDGSNNNIRNNREQELEYNNKKKSGACGSVVQKKTHECPVCLRVFASGQALGGHKRTHVTGSVATTMTATVSSSSAKLGNNSFIDLNLPAPIDEDDVSQIENSAMSDAEFVKTH